MKKIPLILALLLALLTGSAWGTQTFDDPVQLDFPQNGKLFVISDSWSNCFFQSPTAGGSLAAASGDSSMWDAGLIPYIFPDAAGNRRTDATKMWALGSDGWYGAAGPGNYLGSHAMSKARFHSAIRTWPHKLADLLGTPYWHVIAANGARLVSTSYQGVDHQNGAEWYGINNPWVGSADVVVVHIGANDVQNANSGTFENIKAHYEDFVDNLFSTMKPSAKLLLLGMRPWGGSAYSNDAGEDERADSIDCWLTGRAPFSDDSTNEWASAEAMWAAKAAAGRFSTFSFGEYLRDYGADTTMVEAYIKPKFSNALTSTTERDYVHTNMRGDNYIAQLIARHVFGADTAAAWSIAADTLDSDCEWVSPLYEREPQTIYVDNTNGDDIANWMDPFNPRTPLATIQAAVWRASPGDSVVFAQDEYGDYFSMRGSSTSNSGFVIPSGISQPDDDRIVLDGGGSTVTRTYPGVGLDRKAPLLFYNSFRPFGRPDSMDVSNLTFRNFNFVNWDTTSTNVAMFQLDNTTGIRLENCTWDVADVPFLLRQIGNTTPEATVEFTLDGCTLAGGWAVAGTGNLFNITTSGGNLSTYPVAFTVRDNVIVDTVGVAKTSILYSAGYPENASGSKCRATFTGNTIIQGQQDFTTATFRAGDTDLFLINNYIRYGFGTTGVPDTLRSTSILVKETNTDAANDTLALLNNIIEFKTSKAPTSNEQCSWTTGAQVAYRNYHNLGGAAAAGDSLIAANTVSSGWFSQIKGSGNVPQALPKLGGTAIAPTWAKMDTIRFGGRLAPTATGFTGYTLDSFGVEHGTNHASIGPTQYTESPYLTPSTVPSPAVSYARMETVEEMARLVSSGVLQPVTIGDQDTYYLLKAPASPSEVSQLDLMIEEWRALDDTERGVFRITVK